MKTVALLIFSIFSLQGTNPSLPFPAQQQENFDWITGEWVRTNDKSGITTTEIWKKETDSMYVGTGLATKNNETVFREDLRLLKKSGKWVYEVSGVNEETTNFILTAISEDSFTAINPENPFPKLISYRKESNRMIAEISDDSRKIIFEFKKTAQK